MKSNKRFGFQRATRPTGLQVENGKAGKIIE
jgi:hypothetical protein